MNKMNRPRALWIPALFVAAALCPAAEPPRLDLTLPDCVRLALENNLDLKIEKGSRASARFDVALALGGYDPTLTLSGKRTHRKTAPDALSTTGGSETDSESWDASVGGTLPLGGLRYDVGAQLDQSDGTSSGSPFDSAGGQAGVTLTQPLLKGWGRFDDTRYRVTVARSQSAESALQLEARTQAILARVESAWYALIQAREGIRVQEEAVRLATRLFEDNRNRVRIGAMSMLDEKQAESQAATARAALSAARRSWLEAQNQLKLLIFADYRAVRNTEISAVGDLTADPVPLDAEASGERALQRLPALRQARLALERQDLSAAYQRNQTRPAVNLVGGYGWAASQENGYGKAVDEIGSGSEPYGSLALTVSVPLGNRAARNRYAQSLIAMEKQQLTVHQLAETALANVENAVAAVQSGLEQVASTREARDYAEQALVAEQRKLERGESTSFIVLQLQRDLTQARKAEIQAMTDYHQQLSTLALAEGTLFEHLKVDYAEEAP